MAAGKGGSSNNQSGSYNGQTSGTTTGDYSGATSGTSNGASSGSTSTTGTTANNFSNSANAPAGYQDAWKALMSGGGAADYFKNQMNNGSFTLASDQQNWPGLYKPIQDVTPQSVSSTGADAYVGKYMPFVDSTLGTSLAAYDKSAADSSNAFRAGSAGAFGNKRLGVAQGQLAADSAVGRGALASNILRSGYDAALTPATADANRAFGASSTNAGNSLTAGIQNQNNQTGQQEFDVNAAYQGQQARSTAASNFQNSLLQNLGAGNPLIGQSGSSSGSSSTDQISNFINSLFTSGASSGSSSGTTSGSSSGNSSGNSSGKSGGISL